MGYPLEDDLTPIADAVREAYLTPPDEATEARHLAAMAEAARVTQHEAIPVRSRTPGLKEAVMTRFRTAALAAKLAALSLFAALMTGGLATAGVIDLPGSASDRADAVHEAIDGADPSETPPGTLIEPAGGAQASDEEHGKSQDEHGKSVEAQENGADSEGHTFGDTISDEASGGVPKDDGRAFGERVSGEAKDLGAEPQGGPEIGETHSQGSQETGETHSQAGQDIAESHGGGKPQD